MRHPALDMHGQAGCNTRQDSISPLDEYSSAVSVGMFSASRCICTSRHESSSSPSPASYLPTQTVGLPRNECSTYAATSDNISWNLTVFRAGYGRVLVLGRFSVRAHPPIRGQARCWSIRPRSASGRVKVVRDGEVAVVELVFFAKRITSKLLI